MEIEIPLPRRVGDDEQSLNHLLSLLPWNLDGGITRIIFDWERVEFLTPSATVALAAGIRKWRQSGRIVDFRNAETSSAYTYLQRIDFFACCGIESPESFQRHPSRDRFFPVTQISNMDDVQSVSTQLARCISPESADSSDPEETGLLDLVEYSISELATNVVQHSQSSGFVSAQYYENTDRVIVAIADSGIGIRESFRVHGSPHWSESMSDLKAIEKSLEYTVSSRTHLVSAWGESVNAGVGLTFLKMLATTAGGDFYVISGAGCYGIRSGRTLAVESNFGGTLCIMSFQRSKVSNFFEMFSQIKIDLKNIRGDGHEGMFQ